MPYQERKNEWKSELSVELCELLDLLKDAAKWLKEVPKGCLCYAVSQRDAHASRCPFGPVGPLAPISFQYAWA